ncbi:MAG: hypothetical protein QM709_04360 [Spongiibacteraceae bacterium]
MSAIKTFGLYFLRCLCITALSIGLASAQERHLRTYTLKHTLAEQITPMLSAYLSAGSSITPYRQQLILNVTDAEYRQLQTLLDQFDTAPRSLMISVRKQSQQSNDDERYGVQGRIGDGAVQVQSGNGYHRSESRVIVNRGSAQSSRDGSQQVRAVEGMAAFINTGNIVSMRSGNYGQRELVPVDSGFYATARIVGDEVIVDLDQRDDRVQDRTQGGVGIATQNLQTQVRGNLGEWIPVGGVSASQSGNERSITNYGNNASSSMSDIAIKVEIISQ